MNLTIAKQKKHADNDINYFNIIYLASRNFPLSLNSLSLSLYRYREPLNNLV